MSTKIKCISEEFENLCNQKPRRKCGRSTAARVVAISMVGFVLIMMSIIYHGIVLDRMDKLRQIMALNEKHQHTNKYTSNPDITLNEEIKAENSKDDIATTDNTLRIQHMQLKYFRHRIPRDLTDLLDPIALQRSIDPDFNSLYAKVRNKRTKIFLSKLEKEYVRCKKESMSGNDCMVAFVKMYNIAKDISDKMEQMKAIFKDSELILQKSTSVSNESKEKPKEELKVETKDNQTQIESYTNVDNDATTGFKEDIVTTTDLTTNIAAEITTLKSPKYKKPKPIKISWIIDGNDDEEDFDILPEEEETHTTFVPHEILDETTPTTTTTTVQYNYSTSLEPTADSESNTTFPLTTKFSFEMTTEERVQIEPTTQISTTRMLEDDKILFKTTEEQMDIVNLSSTTTEHIHRDVPKELKPTTDDINTDEEKLRKLKFDWIIDSEDLTAEIRDVPKKLEPTTDDINIDEEKLRKLKFDWIIYSEDLTAEIRDVPKKLEPTTDEINTDEEKLRKLKFDWIIDSEDLTAEISDESKEKDCNTTSTTDIPSNLSHSTNITTTSTTMHPQRPTKPKPIKISWIIDSDAQSDEKSAMQTTTTVEQTGRDDNVEKEITASPTMSTTSTTLPLLHDLSNKTLRIIGPSKNCSAPKPSVLGTTWRCTDSTTISEISNDTVAHPLDNPSSLENMLESFERREDFQPIIQLLNETAENLTTLRPKGVYDRLEWEKKFKESAAQHRPQDELFDTFGELDAKSVAKFEPKFNPANTKGLERGNTQFMTLCERMSQQMRNKAGSGLLGLETESENFTQSPNAQFTSRGPGGFPVTGETMKASAQFMYNPNFGMPTIPVCFYVTPASLRMFSQAPMWMPSYFGMQGSFGGSSGGLMGGSLGGPGGIFFVPQNFGGTANFFPHTGGSASSSQSNLANIFSKNATPQKQQQQQQQPQQFYCTYMQNQQNQNGNNDYSSQGIGGSGLNNGVNGINFSNQNFKMRNANQTSPTDVVYASYAGLPNHLDRKDNFQCPLPDEVACYAGNECIRSASWCDGFVDCADGSDEAACTCRDRLSNVRICDGYADCPMEEDEIGCYGCGEFMFSCYSNVDEYEHFNRSLVSMCYSSMERCDSFTNCLNGRDEQECNIIVSDVTHHMSHSVSASEGFLYHNYQGEWYPVCNNAEKWAKEACKNEGGISQSEPMITHRELSLPGPFIEPSLLGNVHFPQSCQKRDGKNTITNLVSYVKCSSMKCGIIKRSIRHKHSLRHRSKRIATQQNTTERPFGETENARIVGGSQSKPMHWPFAVAIYRNGNFHCGGTIYSEHWIISAAHCAVNYQKYFYEIRAGVLRRSSYAASTQIHPVSHIVVHQAYERRSMRNDLSLMRLAAPLKFNRWVKPICLPDLGRTTAGNDWIWGPEEKTVCTVVGWGAVREKGPGSDNLREVNIPIRKGCTDKEDREAEDVCAGESDGGRDACQGDSGGPLFCRSVSNVEEWYLAAVVSHGNGCARKGEYGVYTRVALYLDWIEMAVQPKFLPKLQPKLVCPGHICVWGGQRCIAERKRCDRIVDCLGGEDEVGCIYNFVPDVGSALNDTSTESDYYPEDEEEVEATTALDKVSEEQNNDNENTTTTEIIDKHMAEDGAEIVEEQKINPVETTVENDKSHHNKDKISTIKLMQMVIQTRLPSPEETTLTPLTLEEPEQTSTVIPLTSPFPTAFEDLQKLTDLAAQILVHLNTTKLVSNTTEDSTTITTTTTQFTPIFSTDTERQDTTLSSFVDLMPTEKTTVTLMNFDSFEVVTDESVPVKTKEIVNTTESILKVPQKFICQKIPQIIEVKHRCDRIVDCEDGTDEDSCSCRDYLKGPLSILICDGKNDCEDLTDENNCGNCSSSEFLCHLSKKCISLRKRCDNVSDCTFKEDEKDCFALTNGKDLLLDSNKKPTFSNAGIFSRNLHGTWRVVCSHETLFHTHGAKTAADVCSLLGFKGYKYFNTTTFYNLDDGNVPIDPIIEQKSRFHSDFSAIVGDNLHFSNAKSKFKAVHSSVIQPHRERIEKVHAQCLGLYLECNAKSNRTKPMKTISAGIEIAPKSLDLNKLKPTIKVHVKPNVFAKSQNLSKAEEILDKFDKAIDGNKKNLTVLINNKMYEALEELHWPWLVDVYTNGQLWCIGVLVDKYWILVHESCLAGIKLNNDYVAALFGGGKTKYRHHKSSHEEIRRIDCFDSVPNSNVLLYHLENPVRFSHHILPTFLPETTTKGDEHECLSVVHDNVSGRIKTLAITENKKSLTCTANTNDDFSCYQFVVQKPVYQLIRNTNDTDEDLSVALPEESQFTSCKQFGNKNVSEEILQPSDQGILVCRELNTGWYPTALFSYNNTECSSFKQAFIIRTIQHVYKSIEKLMDSPKCNFPQPPAACHTLRCPLGTCLKEEQICDGHNDCHDGSDEFKSMCMERNKACQPSELKCRSTNKCIPKTKFCDHVPDCDDFTDEPTICSCFTYLQATEPAKICDGIRNCWDKSDESPAFCNCTADRFHCGSSTNECIPHDFVCDQESDCPNGEDEKYCFGIEHPMHETKQDHLSNTKYSKQTTQYGQVIEQNYGIWHTKCFPKRSPPDVPEIRQICAKLGYSPFRKPSYRLIDDAANIVVETNELSEQRGRNSGIDAIVGKYRESTKAVVASKFSLLHLNEELTLIMKPSRPIAELVRWNATDSSNCLRLEIKCG